MKNLREKQLLVNLSRMMGEEPDPTIVRELEEHAAFEKNIREKVRASFAEDLGREALKFTTETLIAEEKVEDKREYPLPPSLDDLMMLIEETKQEIQEAQELREEIPEPDLQQQAMDIIAKQVVAPTPQPQTNDITALQKKLQYLEQWLSRVAATGPGSGETKFKFLDDIEKNTIGDTDQILRYRPDPRGSRYGTFFFGQLSGHQGPIQSMLYNPTQDIYSGNVIRQAGLTYYDSREDTLEIIHADGTATYTGQDNYIRVYNNYGTNLTKGTFVQFSGAAEDVVTCVPYINTANNLGLYAIGVLATDIETNTIGRAKLLGEIRNIDTTGSSVGETWELGDLLWSNPASPGALTKNKPTAPNVVISVAAVLKANATSGIMLVRPAIWPRLQYADFSSQIQQIPTAPNEDNKVMIANVLITTGFTLSSNSIVATNSGLYKFDFRAQLSSSSSSQKSIVFWYKKNEVNVPFSAVRQSIATNGGYATINNTQLISLNSGDNVSIHFAATDTTIFIDSPAPMDGSPNVPSVQITVIEAAL